MAKPNPVKPELSDGEDLGVFEPEALAPASGSSTIPELAAFRDTPTRETHLAACRLLSRTGPLALDGLVYSLHQGRVITGLPQRSPTAIIPDDPREVI